MNFKSALHIIIKLILKFFITEKSEVYVSTNKEISSNKPSTSKSTYNVDISTNTNEIIESNEAAAHLIHGKFLILFFVYKFLFKILIVSLMY